MTKMETLFEIEYVKLEDIPPSTRHWHPGTLLLEKSRHFIKFCNQENQVIRNGIVEPSTFQNISQISKSQSVKLAGYLIRLKGAILQQSPQNIIAKTKKKHSESTLTLSETNIHLENKKCPKIAKISTSSKLHSLFSSSTLPITPKNLKLSLQTFLPKQSYVASPFPNHTSLLEKSLICETNSSLENSSIPLPPPTLDPTLTSQMKPHQITAATFLLNRLMGGSLESFFGSSSRRTPIPTSLPPSGALLADEMGMGKTLIAITVMWSLIREGRGKALVVVPSSLITNWEREIRKWAGTGPLARGLLVVRGSKGDSSGAIRGKRGRDLFRAGVIEGGGKLSLETFISSPASLHPVLLLSFDLFRSFASKLNRMTNLEVLVVDEAHRLKNQSSLTSQALAQCVASQRLIVTGTPIQNSLIELYSLVDLACPFYLGTKTEFQSTYSTPIQQALEREESSCPALDSLSTALSTIMVRRRAIDLLSAFLPPRREFVVFGRIGEAQFANYMRAAQSVLKSGSRSESKKSSSSQSEDDEDENPRDEVESDPEQDIEIEIELDQPVRNSVLAGIMSLRLILNGTRISPSTKQEPSSITRSEPIVDPSSEHWKEDACIESQMEEYFAKKIEKKSLTPPRDRFHSSGSLESLFQSSWKYQVVDSLLHSFFEEKSPSISPSLSVTSPPSSSTQSPFESITKSNRVVIVSGFTSTLDSLASLMKLRDWPSLRLDGGVSSSRRTAIVDTFNKHPSPFNVLLLSSKAGGVGLNLTGANKMILMEPDWNPSVDSQVMGRIWRQGQERPVSLFRLVSFNTIEESILQRQYDKGLLSSVLGEVATSFSLNIQSKSAFSGSILPSLLFPHSPEVEGKDSLIHLIRENNTLTNREDILTPASLDIDLDEVSRLFSLNRRYAF